jgi:hypothetical protein
LLHGAVEGPVVEDRTFGLPASCCCRRGGLSWGVAAAGRVVAGEGQSKITKTSESENVRMKACEEAEKSNKFIRIVQRRDLPWEQDSIARAAYDREHIPDCNVQATVGKHFLFHEEIPKAANGLGYLRVTTKSLALAARTLSKCMDVRRTHDMHGKRVSVDHQQHDVEPPPNDVVSSRSHRK